MSIINRWSMAILLMVTLQGGALRFADAEEPSEETRAKASRHFDEGRTHFKLGEFKPALDSFKEAYRLVQRPAILYNIAQCYRLLGEKEPAIRAYRSYLSDAPTVPNRPEVEALIVRLQEQVASEQRSKEAPPQGVLNDGQSPPRASSVTVSKPGVPGAVQPAPTEHQGSLTATPLAARKPVYKKWWLWTAVGVAVVGLGVGLGIGLTQSQSSYHAPGVTF